MLHSGKIANYNRPRHVDRMETDTDERRRLSRWTRNWIDLLVPRARQSPCLSAAMAIVPGIEVLSEIA
jgi:hypothetical protein